MAKKHDKSERDIQRLRLVQRRSNVARLRAQGYSVTDIAEACGISRASVERDTEEILQRIVEDRDIMFDGEEQLLARYPKPQAGNEQIRIAYQMRLTGLSYYEIGQHLGVSDTAVENWLVKEVTRLETDSLVSMEKARRIELDRLDNLQTVAWAQAVGGNLDAVKVCLAVMKRRSELLGLDAPTRINIEQEVRELARANGLDEEAAVLEAKAIIKANSI